MCVWKIVPREHVCVSRTHTRKELMEEQLTHLYLHVRIVFARSLCRSQKEEQFWERSSCRSSGEEGAKKRVHVLCFLRLYEDLVGDWFCSAHMPMRIFGGEKKDAHRHLWQDLHGISRPARNLAIIIIIRHAIFFPTFFSSISWMVKGNMMPAFLLLSFPLPFTLYHDTRSKWSFGSVSGALCYGRLWKGWWVKKSARK